MEPGDQGVAPTANLLEKFFALKTASARQSAQILSALASLE
jgi:hypothetical protein